MTKLLITGASGLLGSNLALSALESGYDVTGWTNTLDLPHAPFQTSQVDLTASDQISERIAETRPDVIIHCAALANVDTAEKNGALAYRLNAEAPAAIAAAAARQGIRLIHISTDAVFDGTKGDYTESDMPHPLNTYAHSKLKGEEAVAELNPDALIARVVFYGWSIVGKRSLAEFFYNHLTMEQTVMGFTDMIFTPLYVGHLAEILLKLAAGNQHGLFHVFGAQPISKYAFGVEIAREFDLDETLVSPTESADVGLAAARPLNLSMRSDKLCEALGLDLPSGPDGIRALKLAWQEGLREKLAAWSA